MAKENAGTAQTWLGIGFAIDGVNGKRRVELKWIIGAILIVPILLYVFYSIMKDNWRSWKKAKEKSREQKAADKFHYDTYVAPYEPNKQQNLGIFGRVKQWWKQLQQSQAPASEPAKNSPEASRPSTPPLPSLPPANPLLEQLPKLPPLPPKDEGTPLFFPYVPSGSGGNAPTGKPVVDARQKGTRSPATPQQK